MSDLPKPTQECDGEPSTSEGSTSEPPTGEGSTGGVPSLVPSPPPSSPPSPPPSPPLFPEPSPVPASSAPPEIASAAAISRAESDAAELVLELLDEQWFCDNVVGWPLARPGSPPGVIDKDIESRFRWMTVSGSSRSEVVAKQRPFAGTPFSRPRETRRLSDGDHHLRRYHERDAIPRRRLLEALVLPHRRPSDLANSAWSSPRTPSSADAGDQSRFCSEAKSMKDVFSPLALPPSIPLMGVTEDQELENDLYAKMLANRPAKLMTINPGRFARGPLQESSSNSGEAPKTVRPQLRQRRRLKGTKSLTDLEYEELRGLSDLGFEAPRDDMAPHAVRRFPGLQRQASNVSYNSPKETQRVQIGQYVTSQSRFPPTLLYWPDRAGSPLPNAPFLDRTPDMKGQLQSWASEMASIVSTEC